MTRFLTFATFAIVAGVSSVAVGQVDDSKLDVSKRSRTADEEGWVKINHQAESWKPSETAVIVCDMWDAHHCLNAVRRVNQIAPKIDELLKKTRSAGATIIHAPSSCLDFYKAHPARKHVQEIPKAKNLPQEIEKWLNWKDDQEEKMGYPIDHTDGGEDDDLEEHQRWHEQLAAIGRNPKAPWVRQIDTIGIEDTDFITDDGVENWSILEHRGIKNVMIVGVHTNMCVLGRPFGLRQLSRNGKNVVLVRDLTDTMYNPKMRPYVNHFSGTDLIIEHTEQFVCPTISSDQILGGTPVRFRNDRRPHVVMLIGEQEYNTRVSLPKFARKNLYRDFRVSYVFADEKDGNHFHNIEDVLSADLLLVSVRRRTPTIEQLKIIRGHVELGKPVVGIRTASHAFSLRGKQPPEGHAAWPEFDADVFGGNYQGHHGNKKSEDVKSYVWPESSQVAHPLFAGCLTVDAKQTESQTTSWLYKTSPLKPGTRVLMTGRVGDRKPHEPVTWTYIHRGGGRSFYTSLGHVDDFADAKFQQLLTNAVYWALDRPIPRVEQAVKTAQR